MNWWLESAGLVGCIDWMRNHLVMSSIIRGAVSKKKRRYQKNGFDLDLTYVTPRIIAMGFPSENVEAAYRNPMKEVLRFLDSFHKDHYKVYNLCSERSYDHQKFYNRVETFPFEDHNAPPFELIIQFCHNVQSWLDEDEKNIAVIHCKAGKGRTGLMISAWMLFSKEWTRADDALTFYAAMRTYNKKGVTIPSQIRYVYYFEESLQHPLQYQPKSLLLNRITFHTLPKDAHIPDTNFLVFMNKTVIFDYKENEAKLTREEKIIKREEGAKKEKKEKRSGEKKKKDKDREKGDLKEKEKNEKKPLSSSSEDKSSGEEIHGTETEEETYHFEVGEVPICGDIKVEFTEKGFSSESKMFSFWFCTSFVKENRLVLKKDGLDKAHKDKNHRLYPENFRIELEFSEMVPEARSDLEDEVRDTFERDHESSASSASSHQNGNNHHDENKGEPKQETTIAENQHRDLGGNTELIML